MSTSNISEEVSMDNKRLSENGSEDSQNYFRTSHKGNTQDDEFNYSDNPNRKSKGYGKDMHELSSAKYAPKITPKEVVKENNTESYRSNRKHGSGKENQEIKSEIQKKPESACNSENILKEKNIVRELDKLGIQSFQNIPVQSRTERSNILPGGSRNPQKKGFMDMQGHNNGYVACNSSGRCKDSSPGGTRKKDFPKYEEKELKTHGGKNAFSGGCFKEPHPTTHNSIYIIQNKSDRSENTASPTSEVSATSAIINLVRLFNVKSLFSEEELSVSENDKDADLKPFMDFIDTHKRKIISAYKSTALASGSTLPPDRDRSKDPENDNILVQHIARRKESLENGTDKCLHPQYSSIEMGAKNKFQDSKSNSRKSLSNTKEQNVTKTEKTDFRVPLMATYRIRPDSSDGPKSYKIPSKEVKKYLIESDDDKKLGFIIKKMTDAQPVSGIRSLNLVTFNDNIPDGGFQPLQIPEFYDVLETGDEEHRRFVDQKRVECCNHRHLNVDEISTDEAPESPDRRVRKNDSDTTISMNKKEDKLARTDGVKVPVSEKCPNIGDPGSEVNPSSLASIDGRHSTSDVANSFSEMKINPDLNKVLSSALSAHDCAKSVDIADAREAIKKATKDERAQKNSVHQNNLLPGSRAKVNPNRPANKRKKKRN